MELAKWAVWGSVVGLTVLTALPVCAEDFKQTLATLLSEHDRIVASEKTVEANRNNLKALRADWFPEFEVTGNYGYELQRKGQGVSDTSMPPREVDLSLTQKVWDFGDKNAEIKTGRLTLEQSEASLELTRQTVLLEALKAHLDLQRKHRLVTFAQRSEDNIKKQTGVEEARVLRGGGIPTDVLQAKTQLAGAQSLRVQRQGDMVKAVNRYEAVFGHKPENLEHLAAVRFPAAALPESQEEGIRQLLQNNPKLAATRYQIEIGKSEISRTFADEFFPEIEVVGETNYKRDVDGTIGGKQEHLVKVEVSMPFNLGLKSVDKLRAAEASAASSSRTYAETEDLLVEQVKNAWQDLETARAKADFLKNQSTIAEEFLVLARKERRNGTRSLIDVLSGETSLINALSESLSAETDVVIAGYSLLYAIGRLDLEAVSSQ